MMSTANKNCFPKFKPFTLVFVFLAFQLGNSAEGNPLSCQHPDNRTLQQQWTLLGPAQNVSSLASQHRHRIDTIIGDSQSAGNTCPSSLPTDPDLPEERRSLCPWGYRMNHDPTRYPADLPEAFCLCQDCISNKINNCVAVYYNVPVLRQTRTCSSGTYVYEATFEKIAVGCMCTQPRLAEATNIEWALPDLGGF